MPKKTTDYYDEPEETSATALLSKSILQGKECKVGDTITLRVTAVRDGEVQVEPTQASSAPPEEAPEEAPPEETAPEPGEPVEAGDNYD